MISLVVRTSRLPHRFCSYSWAALPGSEKVNGIRPNPAGVPPNFADLRQRNFWIGLALLLAIILLASCIPLNAQDARKVKSGLQPAYPELARKNNIQGVARLQVVITPDGSVKDIKVLGGSPVLTQAAIEAVKKWKYEPAQAESLAVLKFEFKP